MRVLLTGATGFIGSRVQYLLLNRGDLVRILALPGTERLITHSAGVTLVKGALDDHHVLHEATRGIEVVYHLAGLLPSNPPGDITRVNEHGTENLLDACVGNGVRRIVFSSSTSVYDEVLWPLARGLTETSHLWSGATTTNFEHYALSKIKAERLILRFHRDHGLQYVILRSPQAYGSGDRLDGRLLKLMSDQPWITLSRRAQIPSMQWVHVDDLAEGLVLAGIQPNAANHVFNIAGAELFSLRDFATTVWSILKSASSIGCVPREALVQDNRSLKYDFSKARKMLGYTPRVTLHKGLGRILSK